MGHQIGNSYRGRIVFMNQKQAQSRKVGGATMLEFPHHLIVTSRFLRESSRCQSSAYKRRRITLVSKVRPPRTQTNKFRKLFFGDVSAASHWRHRHRDRSRDSVSQIWPSFVLIIVITIFVPKRGDRLLKKKKTVYISLNLLSVSFSLFLILSIRGGCFIFSGIKRYKSMSRKT